MFVESLTLENFQCFRERTQIRLESGLTSFIGPNGSGKTAACQALVRLFGVTAGEREIRIDDFHVPADEETAPPSRTLRVEAILGFPELEEEESETARTSVPSFFHRMTAEHEGRLKCRIVLEATWSQDATLDGNVESRYWVVQTLDEAYDAEQATPLPAAERSRIQTIYVPSSRDGARQVATFLRGRLWRAARWSDTFAQDVAETSDRLQTGFRSEDATKAVEAAVDRRWGQLHSGGTHTTPRFRAMRSEVAELVKGAELEFEPDHTRQGRPARLLSDGQRSLLYLALTSAALDVEAQVQKGTLTESFTLDRSQVPTLTIVAVEEPENSLTPFFLSRIVTQLLEVSASARAQAVVASHSPGVLTRVDPEWIRHFRTDPAGTGARVNAIRLPDDATEAGTFVREAVRARPELYFAAFVVLGEGDTEEIVIPRIAQARGILLDPSFVAMVPLGGRHTQHFWRLLDGLGIPHATLLDLDYGRAGAGPLRLRDAAERLEAMKVDVFGELEGFSGPVDLDASLTRQQIHAVMEHLRRFGVFYSFPLDLDMSMLTKFWDAYTTRGQGQQGPRVTDAEGAVFGEGMTDEARQYWSDWTPTRQADSATAFRWYRYLFLNRSKPGTHLQALARLTDDQLRDAAPPELEALIAYIREKLEQS